jgi:hypothetical protein
MANIKIKTDININIHTIKKHRLLNPHKKITTNNVYFHLINQTSTAQTSTQYMKYVFSCKHQ